MGYILNYITKEEYTVKRNIGMHYTGFVIGYGYVTMKSKVLIPPNQYGYNSAWTNIPSSQTHCLMFYEYDENVSKEAVRLSFRGLFKNGRAVISVSSGMTLSSIATLFDVTVKELVEWNNIENPNKMQIGQRLIVLDRNYVILQKTNRNDIPNESIQIKELTKGTNWLKENLISQTETISSVYEMDATLFEFSKFTESTKGNAKMFNHSIIGTSINGVSTELSNAYELNFNLTKVGVSRNGFSVSQSAAGYVEAEVSLELNNVWDMGVSLNLKEDINRNNISSGVGIQIKPIKTVVTLAGVAVMIVMGKLLICNPVYAPTYSIGPVINNQIL